MRGGKGKNIPGKRPRGRGKEKEKEKQRRPSKTIKENACVYFQVSVPITNVVALVIYAMLSSKIDLAGKLFIPELFSCS